MAISNTANATTGSPPPAAPGDFDTTFGVNGSRSVAIGTEAHYNSISRSSSSTERYFATGTALVGDRLQPVVSAFTAKGAIDTTFGVNGHRIDSSLGEDAQYTSLTTASWQVGDAQRHMLYSVATGANTMYVYAYDEDNGGLTPATWGDGRRVALSWDGGTLYQITSLYADSTGLIIVGGAYTPDGTTLRAVIAKLDRDTGALIPSFGTGGRVYVADGTAQAFRGIAAGIHGFCTVGFQKIGASSPKDAFVACFTSNGWLDTTFHSNGKLRFSFGDAGLPDGLARAIYIQTGSGGATPLIWLAANVCDSYGYCNLGAARLQSNGQFDATFNGTGKSLLDLGGYGSQVGPSMVQIGTRVYVAGALFEGPDFSASGAFLFAYDQNGQGDPSFGTNGLRTYGGTAAPPQWWYAGVTTDARKTRLVTAGVDSLTTAVVAKHLP